MTASRYRRRQSTSTPGIRLGVYRRARITANALRATGSMLRRCAWCGAVTLEGRPWARPDDEREVAYLDRHDLVTHGICPGCFEAEMEKLDRLA